MDINKVTVRWWDGYMEEFETTEVRFGCDLLFMRLVMVRIGRSLYAVCVGLE